eukprot:NODE_1174_length_654_cov_962.370248_g920_i0.p1 GENE.NODE_1174_length_654_cov_962.370248_g920_i0~~NODE_1174_length_654_cov_962.370248_g920_i0.p1  ORF type:complete len:194 (+),score=19.15 NODE_1174_length_654_cov_962.370248_g920_i0:33-614(+)
MGGLQVGPWFLEWMRTSLVIPRVVPDSQALAVIDITQLHSCTTIDAMLYAAADVACQWNISHMYSATNMNCQHFLDALCDRLRPYIGDVQHSTWLDGSCVGMHLADLTRHGQKAFFRLPGGPQFSTHRELDEYVTTTYTGSHLSEDQLRLLKAFDRAMWSRHFHDPTNVQWRPAELGCPFDDPQLTESVRRKA